MKVANNIPQWVLDIFNQIDFSKIKKTSKLIALNFLQMWGNANLYGVNPNKNYPSKARVINKKFDPDLLKLLSLYDYDSVTDAQKLLLKTNTSKWTKQFNVPIKKDYESIFTQ